jgi:16S rRNA (guanine966-N2)-methyltransferase
MRIISGKHRGRILKEFTVKNHSDLRPTTDKNRESLFNILENSKVLKELGFSLVEALVLDGFCGTGSVGLECVSRGAELVTFVDNNKTHIEIAKNNAKILNETEKCEFLCKDITKDVLNIRYPYDLIFLDPPYKKDLIVNTLENLKNNNCINENTIIVLEYSTGEKFELAEDFQVIDERKYGKTIFQFLKFNFD